MNRLVLIGNGFDLAHGLKTSYEDFIKWYWKYRLYELENERTNVSDDGLCRFQIGQNYSWDYLFSYLGWSVEQMQTDRILDGIKNQDHLCSIKRSTFFDNICKGIENKRWVDIENEYYKLLIDCAFPVKTRPIEGGVAILNQQLRTIQTLLVKYLHEVEQQGVNIIPSVKDAIYAPFAPQDISIYGQESLQTHVDNWANPTGDLGLKDKLISFGIDAMDYLSELDSWRNKHSKIYAHTYIPTSPKAFLLPNHITLLNFNYTHTASKYVKASTDSSINHIHGEVNNPNSVIFGYGDELDADYPRLQNLNDNEYLQNVKSIRYLEAPNYRNILSFIESAPFQVLIMGHSCGNSDRTLLNTIFEHGNCVSIKPYYYHKEDGTDNYRELVQNISRNFTDMKLMRDRVVNKTQCEPLVK